VNTSGFFQFWKKHREIGFRDGLEEEDLYIQSTEEEYYELE
jgi:hypothetical protein